MPAGISSAPATLTRSWVAPAASSARVAPASRPAPLGHGSRLSRAGFGTAPVLSRREPARQGFPPLTHGANATLHSATGAPRKRAGRAASAADHNPNRPTAGSGARAPSPSRSPPTGHAAGSLRPHRPSRSANTGTAGR